MWGPGISSTPKWAFAQARLWTPDDVREETAARLFLRRFDETPPEPHTLQRLRGLEGMRVKRIYKTHAERVGLPNWRRNYDPANFNDIDPINLALSIANACLYGLCLAATVIS